jgi:hypothetical protein
MQLPDDFTSFWCASVRLGALTKVAIPEDTECSLTNACIGHETPHPEAGSVVLFLRVNQGREVAIVSFLFNKFESTLLDLKFQEGDVLWFRISGAEVTVDVAGYLVGGFEVEKSVEDFTG